MPQTFTCPNCNAPLSYDGKSVTIRCEYCSTTVIVPAEMRDQPAPPKPGLSPSEVQARWAEIHALAQAGRRMEAIQRLHETFDVGLAKAKEAVDLMVNGYALSLSGFHLRPTLSGVSVLDKETSERICILLQEGKKIEAIKLYRLAMDCSLKEASEAVDAMQLGFEAIETAPAPPFPASRAPVQTSEASETSDVWMPAKLAGAGCSLGVWLALAILLVTIIPILIAMASNGGPLAEPWAKVNPFGQAQLLVTFGGEGSGPGLFQDARYVATDNNGHIFVGEYDNRRIHIFDMQGKFLSQWTVAENENSDYYLRGMAVSREGVMYLSAYGRVYIYKALTGELLGELPPPSEYFYFDDLYLAQDGSLYVMDTYDEDRMLRYDRSGQVTLDIPRLVSTVSGESETTIHLAVDGLGTIYALSFNSEHIYIFASDGRFMDRFGGEGDEEGQFVSSYAIAVDNQSRVYASDHGGVMVFAGDGRYLHKISVPAYVDGMCFNDQNWLFTVSNDQRVRVWEVKP